MVSKIHPPQFVALTGSWKFAVGNRRKSCDHIQQALHISCFKLSLLLLFLFFFTNAFSQTDTNIVKGLTELSLDELSNLKVVSASGSEQTVSEAPSTMTVITADQIRDRGYEQLEDALRDVPGIDIIHLNGYAPSIIYFRDMYGAENLRALLMIDGIVENNIAGTIDLAGPAYSLHNVERIEIIWGPASALYGADAFGGVINIITKKGADIDGVQYEKGNGTYNTTMQKAMAGLHKNNFDVSFAGTLYNTDGPDFTNRNPYYNDSYVNNAWSFFGNIIYTSGKFKTTLGFRAFDQPMGYSDVLNSSTKALGLPSQGYGNVGNIGLPDQSVGGEAPSLYEPYSYTSYLQTEYTVSSKLTILARADFRETGISNNSYAYLSIDTPLYTANHTLALDTSALYRVPAYSYSTRVEGDVSANYIITKQQKLFGGIQIYQDNVEPSYRGEILDTNEYLIDGIPVRNLYPTMLPRIYTIENTFGGYLQYELATSILHSTNLTLGGRYDVNTYYTNPLSPHVAIVNKPDDATTIKLMYGEAFRAPTISEVDSEIEEFGQRAAHPEQVNTYEINLIRTISSKASVQVNGFDNELSNIYVLNNSLVGISETQSVGKSSVQGLEAVVNYIPSKKFSLFANYTYQHGVQTNAAGNKFGIRDLPDNKGNIGITWHTANIFTLSVISNVVGPRLLTTSNPYGAENNNDGMMAGYFVTNIVLTTKGFFGNHVTASINVRNVFNQFYLDPGLVGADGTLYSSVLQQPGRNALVKITLTF